MRFLLVLQGALGWVSKEERRNSDTQEEAIQRLRATGVDPKIGPKTFFDISIGGKPAERVVFGLYSQILPITSENFRALCTGEAGTGTNGQPLHYKGSKFFRIIPNFLAQGGDMEFNTGRGGESFYGKPFAIEKPCVDGHCQHILKGDRGMQLAMTNLGMGTQTSQFYITYNTTHWLDGRHIVFGRVLEGAEVMRKVESVGQINGKPMEEVVIVDSGEVKYSATLKDQDEYGTSKTDATTKEPDTSHLQDIADELEEL